MNRLLLLLFLFSVCFVEGAPSRRGGYEDDIYISLRETRDSLEMIKHEVSNQHAELLTLEEKINSQELIIDSLRDQIRNTTKTNKESQESRLVSLEAANKGAVADIKTLRNHANETAEALASLKKQMSDLEKLFDRQNQNVEHFQEALGSIMEALAIKDPSKSSSGQEYVVQAGDSLDKIAKKYKTTIKALKELNNLSKDTIAIGQKLKIPDKS